MTHHALALVQHLDVVAGSVRAAYETPPGVDEAALKILRWIAWLASAACVGGLIIVGARMAIAHRRGDDTNLAQLGWVLAACVLIGGASSIVAALL